MAKKATREINRDLIYNEILNKIQYGEWKPGTPVSELSLAEMFNVSRTPVREALFLLSRNGFVDIYPQSGSYVARIDIRRVQELLYLRYHLETPMLTELAAVKTSIPEELDKLLLLLEFAAQREKWSECVRLDSFIHEELFRLANCMNLWNLIKPEFPHYTRMRFLDPGHEAFRSETLRSIEILKSIVSCIASGDAATIQQTLDARYRHLIGQESPGDLGCFQYAPIQEHPEYFTNLGALKGLVI